MKIYFKTVGCRVNQIESQSLAEKFLSLGHERTSATDEADILVVNTCTVTSGADRESLSFIKKAVRSNPRAKLVVTGCLATLDPGKILGLAPSAVLFPNDDKENIPARLSGLPSAADFFSVKKSSGRTRAFIKLQDGCDLRCSYCLVPEARSRMSSKNSAAAVDEVKNLVAGGFREIVLCGTRLGMYKCPGTGKYLASLMRDIFALEGEFRVRFSSLEPMEISEELVIGLTAVGDRFCDYFHLPLQSGSDGVLRAMGRPYDTAEYFKKLGIIRKHFVSPGLFADVIVGYPTETEEQFAETLSFVEKCGFAGLHIFRFSKRPNTGASALKELPPAVVKKRADRLHELDQRMRAVFAASMCGVRLKTLILKRSNGRAAGLASNFLNVSFEGELETGVFVNARITGAQAGICSGIVAG